MHSREWSCRESFMDRIRAADMIGAQLLVLRWIAGRSSRQGACQEYIVFVDSRPWRQSSWMR